PAELLACQIPPSWQSVVVAVGIRQQRQETRLLDGRGQLTLVAGTGTGDAARDDLASLGDIAFQGFQVLVINTINAFGAETAKLATTIKTGHLSSPEYLSVKTTQ